MDIISPINIETMALYNPNYSYTNYLIPGLTTFGYLMVILVAAVILISSEFTHDTFDDLLSISRSNISVIILGKSIPHILIHTMNILILAGLIFPMFHIKIMGSTLLVIGFLIYFVIVAFALGLMISSLFHNQMFATELALFIVTPAFIFSGLTFPLWGCPVYINFWQR